MIMSANYKYSRVLVGNKFLDCHRGQSIRSLQTWADEFKTTKSAVQRFFKLLKNDEMINTMPIHKTTVVTICNYDDYNNFILPERNNADTIAIRSKNENHEKSALQNNAEADTIQSTINDYKSNNKVNSKNKKNTINQTGHPLKTAPSVSVIKFDTLAIRSFSDITNSESNTSTQHGNEEKYDERYFGDTLVKRIAIPNNNNNNKENNTSKSISKGAEIENFEMDPTRTEIPPSSAAPPPKFHPMRANLPIPIEECLEVFMTNPYTEKYRMMIANLGDFLGRFGVMREWAEAFNRNLLSENAYEYGIDQWCKRFFYWLNKIPDVRTRDPKEINSLSLKSQDNGNQSKTNGQQGGGNGQYRYPKSPKGPTMGGFTAEQIRQFYEDGTSLGGREEHL